MSGTRSAVGIRDGDGIPGYVRKHGSEELLLPGYVLGRVEGGILQESDVLFGLFSREYAFQSVLHDTDGETVGYGMVECGLDVLPGDDVESGKRFREDEGPAYVSVRNFGDCYLRFGIDAEPGFTVFEDYTGTEYGMDLEKASDPGYGKFVGGTFGNRIRGADDVSLMLFPALYVEIYVQLPSRERASGFGGVDLIGTLRNRNRRGYVPRSTFLKDILHSDLRPRPSAYGYDLRGFD